MIVPLRVERVSMVQCVVSVGFGCLLGTGFNFIFGGGCPHIIYIGQEGLDLAVFPFFQEPEELSSPHIACFTPRLLRGDHEAL